MGRQVRDQPHWDHYVGICEVAEREPGMLTKWTLHQQRRSRSRLSHMPHAPAIGRNDDRGVSFYIFNNLHPLFPLDVVIPGS